MPRMELTEAEVNIIKERRRKTEIDRTHNRALQLAHELMDDILEKYFENTNTLARVELANKFAEVLQQHERPEV